MSGPNLFRRGQWVAHSVVYGSVVQIRDVTGNVYVNIHNERPLYRVDAFPFERPTLSVKRARSQPARLLQTRYAIVDFTGRCFELAHLSAWRDSDEAVSALLLHGVGGQGKSRLAAEFARVSRDLGWRVLQARHASDPAPGPGRGGGQLGTEPSADSTGTLLIVDYAERWPAADLLGLCADATRQPHRARVLLIARSAGVWWQTLAGNDLDRLEIDTGQLELGSLADEDSSPQALFTVARDRFAAALDITGADTVPPPQALGENEGFREALALHMAALAAVDADHRSRRERQPMPALGSPAEVSAYLLTRERAYWRDLHAHGQSRTDADSLGRAVYIAALTGAQTHSHALDAVTRAVVGTTSEPSDRILRDHAIAYPAPTTGAARGYSDNEITFLEPLYPDRLAEDFLALTLPGHPIPSYTPDSWSIDVPTLLLTGIDASAAAPPPVWTRSALTMLTAAAARWPHLITCQLAPLFTAHPTLALHAGGAALASLANLPGLPPAVLEGIEAHLPEGRHTDLDAGSAVVAYRLAHHRLAHTQDPLQHAMVRAHLALRLSYAGLDAEALTAAQHALPAWRQLVQENPAAYESSLADALISLSVFLSNVGRWEEALAPSREAVALQQRLAEADPAAHTTNLARALNNLSLRLSEVGRREEALPPAGQATDLFRRLAEAEPATYETDLAGALGNLGGALAGVGRREEAVAPAQEAAEVFRRLATANPAAYEPDLARVLVNLGRHLSKVGRRGEALASVEEAVEVFRRLAEVNPAAYDPDLASALVDLCTRLLEAGRRGEALAPVEEAVEVFRRLAEVNPAAYDPDLAAALGNLGAVLAEAGRRDKALAPLQEAIAIHRRLAEANPAANAPNLARALGNRGKLLSRLGRLEEAAASTQGAVEVFRWLAEGNPAAYEPELAMALNDHGISLSTVRQKEAALAVAQEAAEVYRRLAKVNPAAHEPNLAMALNNLGKQLSEVGRMEEALAPAEESVALRRRLAAANPAAYEPGLAMALTSLAALLSQIGQMEEALAPAQLTVSIRRPLAKANPDAYEPGYAAALTSLGTYLLGAGRPEEAAAPAQEAVEVYRRMARTNPATYEADLATALLTYALGQKSGGNGELTSALAAVTESLDIYGRLPPAQSREYAHLLRTARAVKADILDGLGRVGEVIL
ncbi:tetratricopeptide repeat protein [Streptomyces sp. NPDC088762]|uniref:tetratricopeptide repeat protein n=1 Tax=Streptomyces sp. NPDC088762 TaxID=3365891 RepID=UPI0038057C1C